MSVSLPANFAAEQAEAKTNEFSGGGDLMEPGRHRAKIVATKYVEQAAPKSPFFIVTWSNTEGAEATDILSLSPKAQGVVASKLKTLNITVSDPASFNIEALIGRYATIEVIHTAKPGNNRTFTNAAVSFIAGPEEEADKKSNAEARDASDPKWAKETEGLPF